jgi:hypothetical protein
MPSSDLETYKVASGELSSSVKFSNLVQELEDNLNAIDADQLVGYPASVARFLRGDGSWAGALSSMTPTLDQGGAVAITANVSKYIRIGDLVILLIRFGVNAAGTTNNVIEVGGLPYNIASAAWGICRYADQSVAHYVAFVEKGSAADKLRFIQNGAGAFLGQTPNFAVAATDVVDVLAVYEGA